MLTWIYAEKQGINVKYQSIEAYPLSPEEISKLNYADQVQTTGCKQKFESLHKSHWEELVKLADTFSLKKTRGFLQETTIDNQVDVCFFDAFAPSKQPEMWELPILEKAYNMLNSPGLLVTYCAKGQLKRDLRSLGFEVQSLSGPPGKKEMVRAIKN